MKGKKPLSKPSRPGKRQTHYLEIKGRPGRVFINYFEFGVHFAVEGSVSLRIPSPIMIRALPGYRSSPVFPVISDYYVRAQAADRGAAKTPNDPVLPECIIGVETKEDGRVSYDPVYSLKQCTVIDHNPYNSSPWIKMAFFDADKLWVTW
jgi:hypothetical protein